MTDISRLINTPIAMTEPALRAAIGRRMQGTPQVVTARDGSPAAGQMYVRDGIAVIPVVGPMYWHSDFMTDFFGERTYEDIAREYTAALEDRSVKGILFHMDTPGGEAAGIHELGEMIYAGREVKPSKTYVAGWGTSGGYWIAAASGGIVTDRLGTLGSVGVIAAFLDDSKWMEARGFEEIVIVSDQSPHKDTDPTTPDGYDRIRTLLTEMGGVFVESVAKYRGVTPEKVINDFGRGWVRMGADAVQAGLADSLGSFEATLAEMAGAGRKAGFAGTNPNTGGRVMSQSKGTLFGEDGQPISVTQEYLAASHPEVVQAIQDGAAAAARAEGHAAGRTEGHAEGLAAGATAERERILGIEALAVPGTESVVAEMKADPTVSVDAAAVRLLQAIKAAGGKHLEGLKAAEGGLNAPGPGAHAGAEGAQDSDARVQGAVAAARKAGVLKKSST